MEHTIPSAFNTPQPFVPPYSDTVYEEVELSKTLHQALLKIQGVIESHRIIIRCEQLPVLRGNSDHFKKLFDVILSLVLSEPPAGSKQFLYVKCEEEEIAEDVLVLSGHHKTYIIHFHSNILLGAFWPTAYQHLITECEQIAKTYSGSFSYTHLNSGSLFTLRLSGKPL